MSFKKVTAISALVGLIAACSTPYQQLSRNGGYEVQQLSDESFSVRYTGNRHSDENYISDLALLKAAELVDEAKCNNFSVVSSRSFIKRTMTVSPSIEVTDHAYVDYDAIASRDVRRNKNWVKGSDKVHKTGGESKTKNSPITELTVACVDTEQVASVSNVMDTNATIKSLKTKHQIN